MSNLGPLTETIHEAGFAFVHADEMRAALQRAMGTILDENHISFEQAVKAR